MSFDLYSLLNIPRDGRVYRVNKASGIIEVDSWGWSSIGYRLSPTGNIEKDALFGWSIISKYKIHPNDGRIVIDNWFGCTDTGFQLNKESGILQENGWFFSSELNQRIEPESGIIQYRHSQSSCWHSS